MRQIPAALQAHKNQAATTTCWLILITPQEGERVGLTTLDRDLVYDDGNGPVRYLAPVGFQPAALVSKAGPGVDTSEFQALVAPEYDTPITEEAMNAGVYDYAEYVVYEVNYEAPEMGHWIVTSGTLGQMRTVDGLTVFGELRSLLDNFRRQVCQLDSRTCRAKFGSQPGEERQFCGYPAEELWVDAVVDSVGLENTRSFTVSGLTAEAGKYVPGLVLFKSGKNAGKRVEIESQDAAGNITLRFTTNYPIEPGVGVRFREDCTKFPGACKKWFGSEWVNHFRGEPYIPIGDEGALLTPGAGVGPGFGGATHEDLGGGNE